MHNCHAPMAIRGALSVWVGVTGVRACIKNNAKNILYSAITMKKF